MSKTIQRAGIAQFLMWMILTASTACAGTSLTLTPSVTGSYTIPNRAPFKTMSSFRVEARIHNFGTCSGNYGNIVDLGPFALRCFLDGTRDIVITDGLTSKGIVIHVGNRIDFVVRIQRDSNAGLLRGEIWNADGSGYAFYSVTGVTTTPQDISGTKQVGGPNTTLNLSWFRWYSNTVATASTLPLNYEAAGDPANLAFWNLENSLTEPRNGMNLSVSPLNFSSTPTYPPVASAVFSEGTGTSVPGLNVARAGQLTSVSALGSFSFADSTALSYQWVQKDGPSELELSGTNTSEISFSNSEFGEYNLELSVTDVLGAVTRKTFQFGAVATDEVGRVIPKDPMVTTIFGPMLRWGLSPWPYLDDRQKAFSDHFGNQLTVSPNYLDEWNQAMPGTITVTNGSNQVTGVGTNFQVDFCGQAGKTTPTPQRSFVIWYPLGGGKYGRRAYDVVSCNSATSLTIGFQYLATATAALVPYGQMNCLGCWAGGSGNNNYYDNVLAHYSMYYRTGLSKYLQYARTLADRWWTSPTLDEGRACVIGGDPGRVCSAPRIQGLTGLLWRAHEDRADMWPGLRMGLQVMKTGQAPSIYDIREQGYALSYISIAAMLDPDPVRQNEFKADATAAVNGIWKQFKDKSGVWLNWSYGYEGTGTNPPNTINLTRGSNIITGNGTANYWAANPAGLWILRKDDTRAYFTLPGSTSTRLILDRNYEGDTALGQLYQMNVFVGYGVQPFTLGIAASGFYYAYQATGDPIAKQHLLDTVYWLASFGIRSATRGLYYGRLYPPCEPDPDSAPNCVYGSSTESSIIVAERYLNGEVIKAFSEAYMVSNDPKLHDAGEALVGAALGKLGGPQSDEKFALELDETIAANKAKNFGFWFGFGGAPTWPAARLGKPEAMQAWMQYLARPAAPVPGGTVAKVERNQSNGVKTTTTCADSSPCAISMDPRLGAETRTTEYQDSTGKRKARSKRQVVKRP